MLKIFAETFIYYTHSLTISGIFATPDDQLADPYNANLNTTLQNIFNIAYIPMYIN